MIMLGRSMNGSLLKHVEIDRSYEYEDCVEVEVGSIRYEGSKHFLNPSVQIAAIGHFSL